MYVFVVVLFLILFILLVNRITQFKKTCLYNIDPLKPKFYIVKLFKKGYTLFFLFLLKNIYCDTR